LVSVPTHIEVVTFTDTEKAAVRDVLERLQHAGWKKSRSTPHFPTGVERPCGNDGQWKLTHTALGAQGNMMVSVQLAYAFHGRAGPPPAYVVFYGCAGTIDEDDLASVYLVAETTYLSLGTVKRGEGAISEQVTLKNKWICADVHEAGVRAFPREVFPLAGGAGSRDLLKETRIPPARVLATDAVIHVPPCAAPPADKRVEPPLWKKGEWTYAQAMAHVASRRAGMAVLVEMESYGIARATRVLGLGEQVVVMRITTDVLGKKEATNAGQAKLLMDGRLALLLLLRVLFDSETWTG
jgi:hypothetical protein